jgi:hypothetical protein
MSDETSDDGFKTAREKIGKAYEDSVADVKAKIEKAKSTTLKKLRS